MPSTAEVVVDRDYQIHRHSMVPRQQNTMHAIRLAAQRASDSLVESGREAVMVEVIIYVKPTTAVAG